MMDSEETFQRTRLTLPMVIVGTFLGLLICVSNVYFGLQIGSISTMSAASALMSFAIFKIISAWQSAPLTPTENAIVQAIASSIASMPLAASLYSVIPAIEYLQDPQRTGPKRFSILELTLWSLGICFFGTIYSAPLRHYFIIKQRLRFPSPYAVAVLIGYLHNDRCAVERATKERGSLRGDTQNSISAREIVSVYGRSGDIENEQCHVGDSELSEQYDWTSKVIIMAKFSAGTALYLFASFFLPVLERLPIFGPTAATDWLWSLSLSPALMAFGAILDPHVAYSMLVGTIIGWGVLSPIAKSNGWASGPVGSMENGARSWLVWISIGLLLGDALGRVMEMTVRTALAYFRSGRHTRPTQANDLRRNNRSMEPLLDSSTDGETPALTIPRQQYVSARSIVTGLLASSLVCIICLHLLFGHQVPIYAILFGIIITFPLCFIVIQSAGETDSVPSNQLSNAGQFLFGLIIPQARKTSYTTMILSAITEAGLWQSAVLMGDLKTAYLLQASPKIMFRAQLIGSAIGTLAGSCVYRFLTSVYKIPNPNFPMPMAYLWINTARLVNGGVLPNGIPIFTVAAMALSASLRLLNTVSELKGLKMLLPSAVAMSIAMLVPPPVTLSKIIGAILRLLFLRHFHATEVDLMSAATGCILTEGTLGIIPALLTNAS